MKRLKITFLLLTVLSCTEEASTPKEGSLVGQWNSYESGTEQTGFNQIITNSLTILYESGLSFYDNGTFSARYFVPDNGWGSSPTIHDPGTWTHGDGATGTYQFEENIISLTYFPGTIDEFTLDLQLVKLDEHHLWFRHSYFGYEVEHHLLRHD